MSDTQKSSPKTAAKSKAPQFSDDEKAAMKERAKELKAEAARGKDADAENEVLAKIAEMPEPDRVMAERIHAVVKANAPELKAKLWYGMPAYAKDGKLVCFFKAADEVQEQVRDTRLRGRGKRRRGQHVADLLRPHQADRRRREEDRGARQEGGELSARCPGRALT